MAPLVIPMRNQSSSRKIGPAIYHPCDSTDVFTIERRGEATVIIPSDEVEEFDPAKLEDAATLLTAHLREQDNPVIVFDLGEVDFFGSAFLTLLLRCWRIVLVKGGQMVLAGVSPRASELLHLTSLDMVWPIYANRAEAIDALAAD